MMWKAAADGKSRCWNNKKISFLFFALFPLTPFALGPEEVGTAYLTFIELIINF